MSWMNRLYDVYKNNMNEVGKFESRGEGERFTLLPVSHVTQSAQIEVKIDQKGNFYQASVVPKNKARTIVPATLDSANRSGSKVAAHYLHDKLFYVAGDYIKYGGESKRSQNYTEYIKQLKEWALSEYSHPKVNLIYQYVKRGTVIEDLVEAGILFVDDKLQLIEKWTKQEEKIFNMEKPDIYKVVTGKSSEALIRFDVLSASPDELPIWEDVEVFGLFQRYLAQKMSEESETGLCYVTGERGPLTDRHGSRLRNAGDMSKLISSNDQRGFTFRGRFDKSNEAVQIGYDVSQKAHNALRWLNQRQGYRSDTRHFITFGLQKPDMIQPFDGTIDIAKKTYDDPYRFLMEIDVVDDKEDNTNLVLAEQVIQAIQGKKHNFELDGVDQLIVMAIDAATTGRLSIVYYQEIESSLFLDRLTSWHQTCQWYQQYYDATTKKVVRFIGTPSTYQIVESIYGAKADEKIKKVLYTRLLPSIVDKANIPKDIVRAIFNRVKNPMSFETELEWQRTINIACSLIKKQYEKEEIEVTLDDNITHRDYLFGRLLAVAEVMERNELRSREENRATNALRYFNAFSQRPARTWMTIRRQLHPYQVRQGEGMSFYNGLIRDIESRIPIEDMNNDALGPLFLLGYSSQIQYLYTKKEQKEEKANGTN